ncbi:amidase [Pelagibius sp.]|uniref:amidase n=1 Tax=Pelagibius sp. TaxID=1931238 RepID=UPI003B506553
MTAPADLTLAEARRMFAERDLCPVEYVEALISRIEVFDSRFHAVLELSVESALASAKSLKSRPHDHSLPLFGIPFLVKDIMDVEGSVTTCQSRAHACVPARRSADCVQRLVEAGGIYLGKASLYEFALGGPHFDAPWPPVRNPWNSKFTPGSSSSGSGAAVAAKFAPLALGSDTGGSIRSPAMMNGVVGLKPTFDRLPVRGLFPLAPSMDTVGPIARTVEDIGLAFDGLVGNPTEAKVRPGRVPKLVRLDHLWREELNPSEEITTLFDAAMQDLITAGSTVTNRRSVPLTSFNTVGWLTLFAEAFHIHKNVLSLHPDRYGRLTREMLLCGAHVQVDDYISAQHLRRELSKSIDDCLREADGIVLPVSAVPPCELEDSAAMADLAAASLRMICNVTGHPALALPIGLSAKGLPIGIQIIGKKNHEEQLIAVGSWVERHISGWVPGNCPHLSKSLSNRGVSQENDG